MAIAMGRVEVPDEQQHVVGPVGGDALTLIAGIMKVRLWLFLLLVGTGKALRYISVVYVTAWSGL